MVCRDLNEIMDFVVEKLGNRSLRSPKEPALERGRMGCGNLLPTLVEKTKPILNRANEHKCK